MPSGWTIVDCYTTTVPLEEDTTSAGACTFSNYGTEYGNAYNLNPGASTNLVVEVDSASGVYPFFSTFSTSIQDQSSASFYTGPSFKLQVMDPSTGVSVSLTPGGSNTATQYTAGTTPYTVSATATCTVSSSCPSGYEVGLPIVWSAPDYTGTGFTGYSFSPASASTGSTGGTSTTFQPSNLDCASDALDCDTVVTATIGTSAKSGDSATDITTVAGPAIKAEFLLGSAVFPSTHYLQGAGSYGLPSATTGNVWGEITGSSLSVSLADKFGNAVSLGTVTGITVTALSGGGIFDSGTAHTTSITCTGGVSCTTGVISYPYFQSGIYSTIGTLSVTITPATGPSLSGASGEIVTSTFATSSPTPLVGPLPGNVATTTKAGSTVAVYATLGVVQKGVPVYLSLDLANSYETAIGAADYGASSMKTVGFGTAGTAVQLSTNSSGMVQAAFTVDTVAKSVAYFVANVTAPYDGATTNVYGNSIDSSSVTTVAGPVGSFIVQTYFYAVPPTPVTFSALTTHSVPSGTLYTDISLADAYGNAVSLPSNANTLQINLVPSAGLLSATSVYITAGSGSTGASFGAIVWTMPSTTGSVTLTATGVVNGKQITSKATVAIVSVLPILFVNSPVAKSGVFYTSSTHPVFGGNASISLGYPSTGTSADAINSVCWTADAGTSSVASGCSVIVSGPSLQWSSVLSLAVGLHTLTFNATDANANTVTSTKYSVLIDNTKPTAGFVTPQNANLTGGSSVAGWIYDTEGDINATSVQVLDNGTALASSQVALVGTNSLGNKVNYTITITGLGTGTHNLLIQGSSYAGMSGQSTTLTVHVTVPPGQSFVVVGTPSVGTLGGYKGINVQYQNLGIDPSVVIFAVWKNNVGQTVGIGASSATFGPGQTLSAFIVEPVGLASGTYTVNLFVWTTSNTPVSITTTISASV